MSDRALGRLATAVSILVIALYLVIAISLQS